jgi:RNA polymerase nonessential primary-like sigma factor
MSSLQPSTHSADLVRTYLRQIGRIPLLTPEQEIEYGLQVQQMMALLCAKEKLAQKLRHEPTIREWTSCLQMSQSELNLALQWGHIAKQKMIESNLRLVVWIAKKYQKRGLELLDLIQEGTIGLERGVEKFDPTKGYKFSSYSYWWIRQAITRAIAEKGRTIRLPIHVSEKLNKIKKAQRLLSQKLGRTPTTSELAAELKLAPQKVREYLEWARLPLSLDLCVGDNQDTELGELLEDTGKTPEDLVVESCLSADLERLMSDLTPQQREVLSLRFGLVDGQVLTLAKISAHLQISCERVRQIEKEALVKLRQQVVRQEEINIVTR